MLGRMNNCSGTVMRCERIRSFVIEIFQFSINNCLTYNWRALISLRGGKHKIIYLLTLVKNRNKNCVGEELYESI